MADPIQAIQIAVSAVRAGAAIGNWWETRKLRKARASHNNTSNVTSSQQSVSVSDSSESSEGGEGFSSHASVLLVLGTLGQRLLSLNVINLPALPEARVAVRGALLVGDNDDLYGEEMDAMDDVLQYAVTCAMAFCSLCYPMHIWRGFGCGVLNDKRFGSPEVECAIWSELDVAIAYLKSKPHEWQLLSKSPSRISREDPYVTAYPRAFVRQQLSVGKEMIKEFERKGIRILPPNDHIKIMNWTVPFATWDWATIYEHHGHELEQAYTYQQDPGRYLYAWTAGERLNLHPGEAILITSPNIGELAWWIEGLNGIHIKVLLDSDIDYSNINYKSSTKKQLRTQSGNDFGVTGIPFAIVADPHPRPASGMFQDFQKLYINTAQPDPPLASPPLPTMYSPPMASPPITKQMYTPSIASPPLTKPMYSPSAASPPLANPMRSPSTASHPITNPAYSSPMASPLTADPTSFPSKESPSLTKPMYSPSTASPLNADPIFSPSKESLLLTNPNYYRSIASPSLANSMYSPSTVSAPFTNPTNSPSTASPPTTNQMYSSSVASPPTADPTYFSSRELPPLANPIYSPSTASPPFTSPTYPPQKESPPLTSATYYPSRDSPPLTSPTYYPSMEFPPALSATYTPTKASVSISSPIAPQSISTPPLYPPLSSHSVELPGWGSTPSSPLESPPAYSPSLIGNTMSSPKSPIRRRPIPLPPPRFLRLAKAIHDFQPETEEEVGFSLGDTIEIIDDTDEDGWWKARVGGREGIIPGSFVE